MCYEKGSCTPKSISPQNSPKGQPVAIYATVHRLKTSHSCIQLCILKRSFAILSLGMHLAKLLFDPGRRRRCAAAAYSEIRRSEQRRARKQASFDLLTDWPLQITINHKRQSQIWTNSPDLTPEATRLLIDERAAQKTSWTGALVNRMDAMVCKLASSGLVSTVRHLRIAPSTDAFLDNVTDSFTGAF